jgi:hypothetical protein
MVKNQRPPTVVVMLCLEGGLDPPLEYQMYQPYRPGLSSFRFYPYKEAKRSNVLSSLSLWLAITTAPFL